MLDPRSESLGANRAKKNWNSVGDHAPAYFINHYLATGGYGNAYYLSTNAQGSNATAIWRAHKKGALFANPCYTQIHPTCIPVSGEYQSKLTLMSESLRNDGRVWVPKAKGDKRPPQDIPEGERDYYLERKYPSYGNLAPRDISSRAAKQVCDEGRGVGESGLGVYLDFADVIKQLGEDTVRERYGNLFDMYHEITHKNAYKTPMRIYPAIHYTMGGLWVDYNLMSNVPGLYVLGEANFSEHGANRLGASALMQGLADGYLVLPYTIGDYLAGQLGKRPKPDAGEFKQAEQEVNDPEDDIQAKRLHHLDRRYHQQLAHHRPLEFLMPPRALAQCHDGRRCRDDIHDADQRFLRHTLIAPPGEGQHHRPGEREYLRKREALPVMHVVAGEQGDAGAEGGGLGQREVHEDHAALDDVQSEVNQQPGQNEARDQRPFHQGEKFHGG
jgi:hypothetical protein